MPLTQQTSDLNTNRSQHKLKRYPANTTDLWLTHIQVPANPSPTLQITACQTTPNNLTVVKLFSQKRCQVRFFALRSPPPPSPLTNSSRGSSLHLNRTLYLSSLATSPNPDRLEPKSGERRARHHHWTPDHLLLMVLMIVQCQITSRWRINTLMLNTWK